jgi:YegS/Rv2252/BmrU family lipid kinase
VSGETTATGSTTDDRSRTLALIVNPAAGGGRAGRLLDPVQRALGAAGHRYHVELTRSIEHARELALAAAQADEVAVAFGGDGLIGAVAGALRETDGVLGILPGGRGNDLARVLRIPLDPVAACAVLVDGAIQPLDLGEAGGRTFVGIASCGFDSDANRIANETRLVKGRMVYAYGAIRALLRWQPARFELTLDGERKHEVTGYSVAAANSRAYGGGMYAAPGAELDDGLLDVVTCAGMSKWRFVTSMLPKVFDGSHVDEPEVSVMQAAEVEITADRPFTVYADGDPIAELPVTVRALAGAVRAIVPR